MDAKSNSNLTGNHRHSLHEYRDPLKKKAKIVYYTVVAKSNSNWTGKHRHSLREHRDPLKKLPKIVYYTVVAKSNSNLTGNHRHSLRERRYPLKKWQKLYTVQWLPRVTVIEQGTIGTAYTNFVNPWG